MAVNDGAVQLYQAAVSGVGWRELLTQEHVLRHINQVTGLPGQRSSLHIACVKGHTDLVELLLQLKADPHVSDKLGDTPLHRAAFSGQRDCLHSLLAYGARVNEQNGNGETGLHKAVLAGQSECVEVLLENGASVSACTGLGESPLHLAAQGTSLDCLRLLLSHKAPPNQINFEGKTAMDLADTNSQPPIILMLTMFGAKKSQSLASARLAVEPQEVSAPSKNFVRDKAAGPSSWNNTSRPELFGEDTQSQRLPPPSQHKRFNSRKQPQLQLEHPSRKAKQLSVQAEDKYNPATVTAFDGRSIRTPLKDQKRNNGHGSKTFVQLGSDHAQSEMDTVLCYNREVATRPKYHHKTSVELDFGHTITKKDLVRISQTNVLQETHLVENDQSEDSLESSAHAESITTQASKFTAFKWHDVDVQLVVPKMNHEIKVECQSATPVSDWAVISHIYSLQPYQMHSHQPLLLSVPLQSDAPDLELLYSRTGPTTHWKAVKHQQGLKLAWAFRGSYCYMYLWQLGSLCVAKQLEDRLTAKPSIAQQYPIQKITPSSKVGETPEITRQKENVDNSILSAALRSLMTGGNSVSSPEPSQLPSQDVNNSPGSNTQQVAKVDIEKARAEDDESMEDSEEQTSDTTSSDETKTESSDYVLYLFSPKLQPVPHHVKLAISESVEDDLDFVNYLNKKAASLFGGDENVLRMSLQRLGVKYTEDVDNLSLMKFWHFSHREGDARDVWRPIAQNLQHMDSEFAEELILHYEVFHLQKQRSAIESSLTREDVQALFQQLYMANCLPDKLKKEIKKLDHSKKLAVLLAKYVIQAVPSSKHMSDFKKALYCNRPDLVTLFSLL